MIDLALGFGVKCHQAHNVVLGRHRASGREAARSRGLHELLSNIFYERELLRIMQLDSPSVQEALRLRLALFIKQVKVRHLDLHAYSHHLVDAFQALGYHFIDQCLFVRNVRPVGCAGPNAHTILPVVISAARGRDRLPTDQPGQELVLQEGLSNIVERLGKASHLFQLKRLHDDVEADLVEALCNHVEKWVKSWARLLALNAHDRAVSAVELAE